MVRAFVARSPAAAGELQSVPLAAQGGASILRWDYWEVPFAAILDVVTTVAFVPSMHSTDTTARDLREIVWHHARNAGLRVRMSNRVLEDLAHWAASEAESWYEMLRRRWRPELARIVVASAGNSVPDPRGPRHHFYAEPITKGDDLFRAVIEAFTATGPTARERARKSGCNDFGTTAFS